MKKETLLAITTGTLLMASSALSAETITSDSYTSIGEAQLVRSDLLAANAGDEIAQYVAGPCAEGRCGAKQAKRGGNQGSSQTNTNGKSSQSKCGQGKCGQGKCGEGQCGGSNSGSSAQSGSTKSEQQQLRENIRAKLQSQTSAAGAINNNAGRVNNQAGRVNNATQHQNGNTPYGVNPDNGATGSNGGSTGSAGSNAKRSPDKSSGGKCGQGTCGS